MKHIRTITNTSPAVAQGSCAKLEQIMLLFLIQPIFCAKDLKSIFEGFTKEDNDGIAE